ncbi:hypothetical protein EYC84_007683 [Monilinia fructicola]|uniref:Uncharacterized protein n=1 Tax=Monilinia fructicola TaxID=38448 RepID=A0A5M9JJ55_MONFR|nr:hypothetical protein EYC84_007683 [Monilinia fructicola]
MICVYVSGVYVYEEVYLIRFICHIRRQQSNCKCSKPAHAINLMKVGLGIGCTRVRSMVISIIITHWSIYGVPSSNQRYLTE